LAEATSNLLQDGIKETSGLVNEQKSNPENGRP